MFVQELLDQLLHIRQEIFTMSTKKRVVGFEGLVGWRWHMLSKAQLKSGVRCFMYDVYFQQKKCEENAILRWCVLWNSMVMWSRRLRLRSAMIAKGGYGYH
jgi:hypothetical protein